MASHTVGACIIKIICIFAYEKFYQYYLINQFIVKKNLIMMFLILVASLFCENIQAQEAYAVFEDGVLTFKYDKHKPEGAFGMSLKNDRREWYGVARKITKVVFDKSFAAYKPTSCANWFLGCLCLTEIQYLEFLNTSEVTDMSGMFSCCFSIASLDLSTFKTDNVTNMKWMFSDCRSLTSLDLSTFKTDKVVYMHHIFDGCSALKTIFVSDNWNTDSVKSSAAMFSGCNNLLGGEGTKYDDSKIDKAFARIDGGEKHPGYFTKK